MTGADGEQMVLSGPEAAALLAQAGISLGEQEQVGAGGVGSYWKEAIKWLEKLQELPSSFSFRPV